MQFMNDVGHKITVIEDRTDNQRKVNDINLLNITLLNFAICVSMYVNICMPVYVCVCVYVCL